MTLGSVVGRGRAALRNGLPLTLLAVAALIVGVAILVQANNRDEHTPVFAEFTATPQGCILDPQRTSGFSSCFARGGDIYLLNTERTLASSTAIVTRGSCCPGASAASITGPRTITVVIRRVRGPVRAQVVVP